MTEGKRFYVPTQATLIGTFRAFRSYLEKVAEAEGKQLAPSWYADSPAERPELYEDQPHLLPPSLRDAADPQSPPNEGGPDAD